MGLDTKDPQHTVALKEAMYEIVKPIDFIEYCRKNKDSIQYAGKTEKLDTLATRYKKTINDIPITLLKKFSKELAEKFKVALSTLRDNEEGLTGKLYALKVDGQQYFGNKEIEIMNAVGGLNRLIYLCEVGMLYNNFYNTSVSKTLAEKKQNALTDNQKRVTALTQKETK